MTRIDNILQKFDISVNDKSIEIARAGLYKNDKTTFIWIKQKDSTPSDNVMAATLLSTSWAD